VLVFPGLRDSGGSALLEAMTLAIPILTLDWAGPGEMVNAESAMMIKPLTPDQTIRSIRDGLTYLATHPREAEALGRSARRRALENFSWQNKGDRINSVYRDLVG
jgi:glycosyltransferase involved in cell wall biosynthesis